MIHRTTDLTFTGARRSPEAAISLARAFQSTRPRGARHADQRQSSWDPRTDPQARWPDNPVVLSSSTSIVRDGQCAQDAPVKVKSVVR